MSTSAFSFSDECCLKTALAFCVLRQRKKRKTNESKLPFCRNLLSPLVLPAAANCAVDHPHLDNMLRVGVTTAQAIFKGHDMMGQMVVPPHPSNTVDLDRLTGVASHLAAQLMSHCHENQDCVWMGLSPWIQESMLTHTTPIAVCSLWLSVVEVEPSISDVLIGAIGMTLQKTYRDEVTPVSDADLLVVTLLQLLEMTIVLTLSKCSAHEMLELLSLAIGSELSLPVAMHDMASFVYNSKGTGGNLSSTSKLLLRLGLHDLMVKLSHM